MTATTGDARRGGGVISPPAPPETPAPQSLAFGLRLDHPAWLGGQADGQPRHVVSAERVERHRQVVAVLTVGRSGRSPRSAGAAWPCSGNGGADIFGQHQPGVLAVGVDHHVVLLVVGQLLEQILQRGGQGVVDPVRAQGPDGE